jgi:UDP-glucuronate 4-epimerase
MALFLFTKAILEGRPIDVYNHGDMRRDFTYIDDIAEGVIRTLDRPAEPDIHYASDDPNPASSNAPYKVFNIGNQDSVPLMEFIGHLEQALGKTAEKRFLPLQDGDVLNTYADVAPLREWTGFAPRTPVAEGIRRFVEWYRDYYQVR